MRLTLAFSASWPAFFNMASAEVVGDVHGQYYDLHLGSLGGADLMGLPVATCHEAQNS